MGRHSAAAATNTPAVGRRQGRKKARRREESPRRRWAARIKFVILRENGRCPFTSIPSMSSTLAHFFSQLFYRLGRPLWRQATFVVFMAALSVVSIHIVGGRTTKWCTTCCVGHSTFIFWRFASMPSRGASAGGCRCSSFSWPTPSLRSKCFSFCASICWFRPRCSRSWPRLRARNRANFSRAWCAAMPFGRRWGSMRRCSRCNSR